MAHARRMSDQLTTSILHSQSPQITIGVSHFLHGEAVLLAPLFILHSSQKIHSLRMCDNPYYKLGKSCFCNVLCMLLR
jgi:hypothetical protein